MKNTSILRGLQSPGTLGKKPMIGFMMVVIGILIFAIIAYNLVNQGPLIKWDLPLAQYFHELALNSSPLLVNIMIGGYYFGIWGIAAVAVILALYFIYKRFWRELVMVSVSLGLSGLIFLIVSNIFMRPRPFTLYDQLIWAGSSNIPGFPSGHAKTVLVFCLLLGYLFLPKIKSYIGKVLVILIALLLVIYVGYSRLFVGDHYLTDIVAGYALGVAWFGLSITLIEWLCQRYHQRKEMDKLKHD